MSKIMAIPARFVERLPKDQLLTERSALEGLCELIKKEQQWRERSLLEEDPTWRQPIPYVLISSVSPKSETEYVLMQRMAGQGETRLHGRHYIGAGGHVEEGDTVFNTALIEVSQELGLPLARLSLSGALVSSGGPVEDVHLCLFYQAHTNYRNFGIREKGLHQEVWADLGVIRKVYDNLEKWSQIIARDFLGIKV